MNQDVYPIFVSYSKNILSQKNYVPGLHGVAWFKIFVFTAIIRSREPGPTLVPGVFFLSIAHYV